MASRDLQSRLMRALTIRAHASIGPDATVLEFVEAWLRNGHTFVDLAQAVSTDLKRPVSRGFVSFVSQRLHPDARKRIRESRLAGRSHRQRSTSRSSRTVLLPFDASRPLVSCNSEIDNPHDGLTTRSPIEPH